MQRLRLLHAHVVTRGIYFQIGQGSMPVIHRKMSQFSQMVEDLKQQLTGREGEDNSKEK